MACNNYIYCTIIYNYIRYSPKISCQHQCEFDALGVIVCYSCARFSFNPRTSVCLIHRRTVLKSVVRLIIPTALFLGGLCEIHFQVVNKVRIIFALAVLLKQFVHLALLASQLFVVQFVEVFVRVQSERGQAVLQAVALHVIPQDHVEPLQLALGHMLQVVSVPGVVLQPLSSHAVVRIL